LVVYFPFAKAELELDQRLRLLYFIEDSIDRSNYEVKIRGYCDFIDDDAFNNELSKDRAGHVEQLLFSNGFRENQILSVEGFGERLANEQQFSEEERRLQRRVELDFICLCGKGKMADGDVGNTDDEEGTEEQDEEIVTNDIFEGRDFEDIEIGEELVLKNMNFYGGRHRLLPSSVPVLLELLSIMEQYPTLRILIVGHICCQDSNGPDGYDLDTQTYDLSDNRAEEIYTYLIRKGIDPTRVEFEGRGPSEKTYEYEKTEAERTANRRVEIVILDK